MTDHILESKLWQAITAVASGIMTNLLYDLLSHSSYVIQYEDSQYTLIANNTEETLLTLCCTFIIFFFIWGTIILTIQIGTKVTKRLYFKKHKKINGYQLVTEFFKAKEQVLTLNIFLCNKIIDISEDIYAKIFLRDLSKIITSLHMHFYPHNFYQRSHMKHYFRKPEHSTIISINSTISKYEFLALIDLLYELVGYVSSHATTDILMTQDCQELTKMLQELTDIANSTN